MCEMGLGLALPLGLVYEFHRPCEPWWPGVDVALDTAALVMMNNYSFAIASCQGEGDRRFSQNFFPHGKVFVIFFPLDTPYPQHHPLPVTPLSPLHSVRSPGNSLPPLEGCYGDCLMPNLPCGWMGDLLPLAGPGARVKGKGDGEAHLESGPLPSAPRAALQSWQVLSGVRSDWPGLCHAGAPCLDHHLGWGLGERPILAALWNPRPLDVWHPGRLTPSLSAASEPSGVYGEFMGPLFARPQSDLGR